MKKLFMVAFLIGAFVASDAMAQKRFIAQDIIIFDAKAEQLPTDAADEITITMRLINKGRRQDSLVELSTDVAESISLEGEQDGYVNDSKLVLIPDNSVYLKADGVHLKIRGLHQKPQINQELPFTMKFFRNSEANVKAVVTKVTQ